MKHFLAWIIQVNSYMTIGKETDLPDTCPTFNNRTQGSICFLTSNLGQMKEKRLLQNTMLCEAKSIKSIILQDQEK